MMANEQASGAVHWIDHVVVGTNDMNAWVEWAVNAIGIVPGPIGGLTTAARQRNQPVNSFLYIGDGSCHFGAFLQHEALPPSKGLGKDTPRYGFFIRPEDVEEHLDRLDRHEIIHSRPVQTVAEGDEGTAIYLEDPDGNQFEFWAPTHMPDGAMEVYTSLKVGRVSSVLYGSRDLQRTASFFEEFCGLRPLESSEIPEDTLVLPLNGGGRMVYNLTDAVDDRTNGHGPWYALHVALTVREDAFFSNYRRMWDGLAEESDVKESLGLTMAEEDDLPARTGLHSSPVGRRWKETYQRGDEFYDWDGHAFHFVGGTPTRSDGSLAVYRPREAGSYLKELVAAVAGSTLP
jgi:catechol 2,3-dioxygenase-like lactoylglutathione lyase family enzyme